MPNAGSTPARLIEPLESSIDSDVRVPGSKSHTNRAFICSALASGRSTLRGVLQADDTEAMMGGLTSLDFNVDFDPNGPSAIVEGLGGAIPTRQASLNVNQSGTTSRFVLPLLTLGTGTFVLDGDDQLRARPFGDLINALSALGAQIDGERLPLTVRASGLDGGTVTVPGSLSSQFLSGLMLSAPCARSEVTIIVPGHLVSVPYVQLTISTMAQFGVEVAQRQIDAGEGETHFTVPASGYRAAEIDIEPDASAASYFFAAAAITGGRVKIEGLGTSTVQGDLKFVDALERMGATVNRGVDWTEVIGPEHLRGIEIDMADISDTAQTLAVVAPFADGPTRVRGIGFIRHKETDRIRAVVTELNRLGVEATEDEDGFTIKPGVPTSGVVDTYDDHRMAMSFALMGLRRPGISISNPGCVNKTFPEFFNVLDSLRFS